MELKRDWNRGNLFVSQSSYTEKILKKFGMNKNKTMPTLLASHFKFSSQWIPKTNEE